MMGNLSPVHPRIARRKRIIEGIELTKELEDGYHFSLSLELKDDIIRFIRDEQECCNFLNFELDNVEDKAILTVKSRRRGRWKDDKDFVLNGLLSIADV